MAKLWYDKHAEQHATKVTHARVSRKFYFGRDKKLAEKKFHQLMADYKSGKLKLFADQDITVEALAESFLGYSKKNHAPATYEHYRHFLSEFVKTQRGKAAEDIRPLDLEKYKQALIDKKLSTATINHAIAAVKILYNWAVKFGLLEKHDLNRAKMLPKQIGRVRFLSDGEIRSLQKAAKGDMGQIVTIFLETGMRLGELAALRFRDIDFTQGQITIYNHKTSRTAKQPRPRVIPLTVSAAEILKRRYKNANQNAEGNVEDVLVFPNRKGGAYNKDTLRRRFDRLKKEAKLDDITIHTLRHTFGSNAVMSGIDLKTVSELMGHTSTRTTEIYAHLSKDHLREAIKKMEQRKKSRKVR